MSLVESTRHVKPLLLQEIRQEEIYAVDMDGQSPWCAAEPTRGLTGQSIREQYSPDTNQGTCGEWKVPEDRVPGTPIKVYFVYSMAGGPGGALILWVLTHVVVPLGGDVTVTATVRTAEDTTQGLDIMAMTEPIELDASLFDGKQAPVQIQLTFNRWADDPNNDTDTNNADLYKIIMEYTAYE